MVKPAVGKMHLREKTLSCPRDKRDMTEMAAGHALLDVCGKCGGQFFDTGEMFSAFGLKADPSLWDRPETGGAVKDGSLACPRCHTSMLTQEVKHQDDKVEIDRCGKCGGIWLDKGEVDQIMAIGAHMQPVVEAERAKAKADLDKIGDVDFSPGLIARFLRLFHREAKPES
jgi:Zn-finger nucleic acid-binding protein